MTRELPEQYDSWAVMEVILLWVQSLTFYSMQNLNKTLIDEVKSFEILIQLFSSLVDSQPPVESRQLRSLMAEVGQSEIGSTATVKTRSAPQNDSY
jgi:hypothetical protein